MSNCKVCGGFASFYEGVHLCTHCRELESMAERVIHKNPEKARVFFRDMVVKAGQTLRAESSQQEGREKKPSRSETNMI
jgi:hypothetical protein